MTRIAALLAHCDRCDADLAHLSLQALRLFAQRASRSITPADAPHSPAPTAVPPAVAATKPTVAMAASDHPAAGQADGSAVPCLGIVAAHYTALRPVLVKRLHALELLTREFGIQKEVLATVRLFWMNFSIRLSLLSCSPANIKPLFSLGICSPSLTRSVASTEPTLLQPLCWSICCSGRLQAHRFLRLPRPLPALVLLTLLPAHTCRASMPTHLKRQKPCLLEGCFALNVHFGVVHATVAVLRAIWLRCEPISPRSSPRRHCLVFVLTFLEPNPSVHTRSSLLLIIYLTAWRELGCLHDHAHGLRAPLELNASSAHNYRCTDDSLESMHWAARTCSGGCSGNHAGAISGNNLGMHSKQRMGFKAAIYRWMASSS